MCLKRINWFKILILKESFPWRTLHKMLKLYEKWLNGEIVIHKLHIEQNKIYLFKKFFQSSYKLLEGFTGCSDGKESTCNVEDKGSVPGLGRSLGEGNGKPLQYSCLENLMDRGAWWATSHEVANSWIRLRDYTFTFHFHKVQTIGIKKKYCYPTCPWQIYIKQKRKEKWKAPIYFQSSRKRYVIRRQCLLELPPF